MKHLALVLSILIALPVTSLAQRGRGMGGGVRGGGMRGGGLMGPGMDEHTELLLLTALLSLNDTQQQQLGAVFDAAVKTAAPLNTQIQNGNAAIFQAIKSGQTDAQIKTLSDQEASARSQLLALQVQTFSKMCAMLTSDQKSQVDDSMFTDIGQFLSLARQPIPEPAVPATAPASPPTTTTPGTAPQ
jgi:Spy/CpxP family protein refolding chaperone